MKIGIDARLWGLEHAGLGRYVIELIRSISKIDKKNKYTIFLRRKYYSQAELPENFSKALAEIKHYTIEEQWLLADMFKKEKLDLLHVPHFNVPLFYNKPFVVTIHDLLWHEVRGLAVTTQNPISYIVKYLGYRKVVQHALQDSSSIIVPSQTIKNKIVKNHNQKAEKIKVTYEAPSKSFRDLKTRKYITSRYGINTPYILYVGSAYPHKNLERAALAVSHLNSEGLKLTFAIASSRSVFLENFAQQLKKKNALENTLLLGFVPDNELKSLYKNAVALIQPSLSEGFGLTGLEAMAAGTPVVASAIEIFKEIYADASLYFDPKSVIDISIKLKILLADKGKRKKMIEKGHKRVSKMKWETLAKDTIKVYEKAVSKN